MEMHHSCAACTSPMQEGTWTGTWMSIPAAMAVQGTMLYFLPPLTLTSPVSIRVPPALLPWQCPMKATETDIDGRAKLRWDPEASRSRTGPEPKPLSPNGWTRPSSPSFVTPSLSLGFDQYAPLTIAPSRLYSVQDAGLSWCMARSTSIQPDWDRRGGKGGRKEKGGKEQAAEYRLLGPDVSIRCTWS